MADIGQAKLEDSNMANYGGEDHRNAMADAARSDKAFKGAGEKVGLEIWRVENKRTEDDKPVFGVARWPKEQYGEFYDGDSYLVMNTFKQKDPETGKFTDALAWDLHFWLGEHTSIDERGVAAYKTVELDTMLNDGPVQHRETMNNESPLFQSYFKGGIQYLSGGIESGFRKVKPEEYKPRLLEVRRTKKTTKAKEVECSVRSMNKGDCYILDLGKKVYKYLGPDASPFEKASAGNLAANIVTGRMGKSKMYEISDDEDFWNTLGGKESDLMDALSADQKRDQESTADHALVKNEVKVFRISDDSGAVQFTAVAPSDEKGYEYGQLDTGDVFIVDSGISIFIWRGHGASAAEKSQAWKLVDQYMEDNNRPMTLPVTVIDEGKINSVFRSSFIN